MESKDNRLYHVYDYNTKKVLVNKLVTLINGIDKNYTNTLIVCIGSNHSFNDYFGPLIGQMLGKPRKNLYQVMGTLRLPVKGAILPESISEKVRSESLIIAIDACVCDDNENVGKIEIRPGSIRPGSAYKEGDPPIGDISILGVVIREEKPYDSYLSESLPGLVYDMAEKTTCIIKEALKQVNLQKSPKSNCIE